MIRLLIFSLLPFGAFSDSSENKSAVNGALVDDIQIDWCDQFQDGLALARSNNLYGVINQDKVWVVEPSFEWSGVNGDGFYLSICK
jgi:hypothetical protein